MDGTIRLESKENAGSTFILTIPFGIDHKAQVAAAGKGASSALNLKGKRALLGIWRGNPRPFNDRDESAACFFKA